MTDEEILKKAIEKAVKGGWDVVCDYVLDNYKTYFGFIFNHSFAKAFWGEKWVCSRCGKSFTDTPCFHGHHFYSAIVWHYHLTVMVLEKSPLKYLEKFL